MQMPASDPAMEQRLIPEPSDPQQAIDGIERWLDSLEELEDKQAVANANAFLKEDNGRQRLSSVFGNSNYLTQCAVNEPKFALDLLLHGPDASFATIKKELADNRSRDVDAAGLARDLRQAKRRAALTIAVADITGVWQVPRVTAALSEIAETALSYACSHALREAAGRGAFKLPKSDQPEIGSGLIVLGMGKLGARELNYSSDIDIIILYDEERIETDDTWSLQKHFSRLARDVLRLMDERTADGYVFRTDLRLRPDPGSTPLAVSAKAGLTYYAERGRDWERAAMIKARAVAGDIEAGEQFLAQLESFIWQKNLDFSAIKEIGTIKRQIDLHKGGGDIAVGGHNVKLGRGGIREIEFFAQAQQLVWAGRIPDLRCRGTIDALETLVAINQLPASRAEELTEAYYFLRRIEHRLQMINDEQTHSLPQDEDALLRVAIFLGYEDEKAFSRALLERFKLVDERFTELFDVSLLPVDETGALNMSAIADQEPLPEDLSAIEELGYADPRSVSAAIRHWVHGDDRGEREREFSAELLPMLLKTFARSSQPDQAFHKFNEIMSGIPKDVSLLPMLHANPQLVGMLANIIERAPNLVDHVIAHPMVFESVLIHDFFDPIPDQENLDQEIGERLAHTKTLIGYLDASRRWVNDRRFQVAVQSLGGLIEPGVAATDLSNITDSSMRAALPHIANEIDERYGNVVTAGLVVIDGSDWGAREMNWGSRPDPIFIFDGAKIKNGEDVAEPNDLRTWSASLHAHLSDFLFVSDEAQNFAGVGRQHDWSLDDFQNHFMSTTLVSELLFLVGVRIVAGPDGPVQSVRNVIVEVLNRPHDKDALRKSFNGGWARIKSQDRSKDLWAPADLQRRLLQIDLATRHLQLWCAKDHPEILNPNPRQAIAGLRDASLLDQDLANDLMTAFNLWQAALGILNIAIKDDAASPSRSQIPDALKPRLAQIMDSPDFQSGTELLRETFERTDRHLETLFKEI
jgi:glutamate-ammonia-ligase adenylyltransferase